jgi:hypothetical protein
MIYTVNKYIYIVVISSLAFMELTTSMENSFDPTPRLISSPIKILFVSFDINKITCDCGNMYTTTSLLQRYCNNCYSEYIKNITNFGNLSAYLDINTNHDETLYFKQIVTNYSFHFNIHNTYLTNCRLCFNERNSIVCSVCYLISFTWAEFTSTVPILYLPWWDAQDKCIVCDQLLEFKSDCQKWCLNCPIIYTGCKYCLTTNIIFGFTEQSQCMKCKRMTRVNINDMRNIKYFEEYFLKFNTHSFSKIANYVKNIDNHSNLSKIYSFIKNLNYFPLSVLIYSANLGENNENSLNLTIPIMFIPFNNNEYNCYCCKKVYSETPLLKQKYCKNCLYWCNKYAINNLNIKCAFHNLDICISTTNNTNCYKHVLRNLNFFTQGWCENCSEILYFKQIIDRKLDFSIRGHFYEINCRICKKLIYKDDDDIYEFKLCSDCYLISFTWIESTSTAPILHLPWWDACSQCVICDSELKFPSNCQKWCSRCFIVYIGCRYCLTTNIIFGFTNKSQCKKCRRIINIDITGNYKIDEFLYSTRENIISNNYQFIIDYVNMNKNSNLLDIYSFVKKLDFLSSKPNKIEWISYSKITNLEKIAEGGYGKIYKASIEENIVAVKEFINSQDLSKYFLNEVIL